MPSSHDVITEERLKYSTRSLGAICEIARTQHLLDLSATTVERWGQLLQLMREADTEADDLQGHDQLLDSLRSFDAFRQRYPLLEPSQLPCDEDVFFDRIRLILEQGRKLSEATNLKAYTEVRHVEARYTADVFELIAEKEDRKQLGFDDFMCTLERLTIAAGFVDTAIDAPKDYKFGVMQLRLSAFGRASLLAKGAGELAPILDELIDPRILASLARMSIQSVQSARIKRRVQPK